MARPLREGLEAASGGEAASSMNTPGKDRRMRARLPMVLAAEQPGAPRDYTENLSASGVFIRTARTFSEGERIKLRLSFPGLLPAREVEGRVVRHRREGPHGPAGVGVAVEDAASRETLEALALAAERPAPPAEPYIVLLVEDNSLVAAMYASALKHLSGREDLGGLAVELAADGAEALSRLRREPRVEFVITDVYMPVMNGFALLEAIRADPKLSGTPVAVITAGNSDERERAAELGAQLFLQKPVKYQDLVATIRALLAAPLRARTGP